MAAGNRRYTLNGFLRDVLEAAVSRLAAPEVALGAIQLQGLTLDVHVHGEELPRRFQDVSAVRAAAAAACCHCCCCCLQCLAECAVVQLLESMLGR